MKAIINQPMLITKEKKFLEICKYSKEGYVAFYPDKVVIFNYMDYTMNNCITYIIDIETPFFPNIDMIGYSPIIFKSSDLLDIKRLKLPIYYTCGVGWVNLIVEEQYWMSIVDERLYKYIIASNAGSLTADNIFGTYPMMDDNNDLPIPNYTELNLKDNDIFSDILAMRAAQGASLLTLDDKYDMILYPSLLPVNKPDKVDIDVYEIDDISFISKFTIKKKIFNIKLYIRFGYVRR